MIVKKDMLERWRRLWDECGIEQGSPGAWFERLWTHYNESHRGYHGIGHVGEGLVVFDSVKHLAQNPRAVEAAWWGHDVIYRPKNSDNEVQSGQFMDRMLKSFGVAIAFRTYTNGLVIATMHNKPETQPDKQLICDIDLSTLGAERWETVIEHTRGIRKEYIHVPEWLFIEKRREILAGFLKRENIFYLDHFRQKYGPQAKLNLAREIDELPTMIAA